MTPSRFLVAACTLLALAFTNSYAQKKCTEIFNPKNRFCYDGVIYDKCDGMQYNPSTHVCNRGIAARATCNGVNYNPLKQRCTDNGVEMSCGDDWYNSSTQFCSNNVVYNKCGGKTYTPKTHHCSGTTIKKNYSGTSTFTDDRDGKTYKTVVIGGQIWMAKNLNYEAEGSVCYDNSDSNCETYGRLYDWGTAMKACPSGWHLPSDAEWQALVNFAGGDGVAGKKLKAKSGWSESGNGTDEFGFSALPGGYGLSDGNFSYVGYYGIWWSSTETYSISAYYRSMDCSYSDVNRDDIIKSRPYSVRCLQD